jgi:hypothetical protein
VARADAVHAATKRKEVAFGPPRPPPRQQQQQLEDSAAGPPRPPGGSEADADPDVVGPPRPPAGGSGSDDSSSSDGGDDDGEGGGGGGGDPYRLPISNEVVLSGFDRAVTTVAVEHTGSRVAAGGVDNMVRLYDFNGMRSDLRPFRWVDEWG